jgi:hypothetical protein
MIAVEAVTSAGDWRAARSQARAWAGFGVLTLAAALATPNGVDGLMLPIHIFSMKFTNAVVSEFQSPNFQHFQPLEIWLFAAILGALTFGVRLPWMRTLMLLALVHLALTRVRNTDILGPAAPLILAAPLAAERRRRGGNASRSALDSIFAELAKPARASGMILAAGVALIVAALPIAHGVARDSDPFAPRAALAAVAAAQIEGPVLNDYGFGGYLIFSGIPTFIDGRSDIYGDDFVRRYVETTHGLSPELPKLLDTYHVTWTLLEPHGAGVVQMDRLPGWHRLFADDVAVVHVRTP